MKPDEQYTHNNNQPPRPYRRLELVFFETIGNRSYIRFTRFAVILILCLIVIPVLAIFAIFLYSSASINSGQVNANVPMTVRPDAIPLPNIKPAPLQPPPKIRMQPLPPAPIPPTLPPESDRNTNQQVQKSPSPPAIKPSLRNINEK